MKILQGPALLCSLTIVAGAEETTPTPKWDVAIPVLTTESTPSEPRPQPEPIDFTVLSSRTTLMDVTKAPEMPELPPIEGRIKFSIELVANPNLPEQPPLPALPPDSPIVAPRLEALREAHPSLELVFLSATVYDNQRTFLRIYPNGKADQPISAWSNLDFNHFCGFSGYQVTHADGSTQQISLLMGIGNTSTEMQQRLAENAKATYEPLQIPKLPDLASDGPSFVVAAGDQEGQAMDTLEQIHDLYRKEGERMKAASEAREAARAERKAFLLANPPKPEDVKIRYWKKTQPKLETESK